MSTSVTKETTAGGGAATASQQDISFKITSLPLLDELKAVYGSIIGRKSHLSPDGFRDFLLNHQHERPPSAAQTSGTLRWVASYFGEKTAAKLLADATPISFEDFQSFICSPQGNALAPPPEQDLSQPLTSYFISSSHNTYLVGHQLYGSSTAEGYINVLRRGCRCIEIDVWDGDDGQPEVFHGYTLVKEIGFKTVCEAIGKHAWETTDLPVIISLECHAGVVQQTLMVEIMRQVWGEMLVEGYCAGDLSNKKLPSPDQLRKKILVKVKYVPPEAPAPPVDVTKHRVQESSSSSSESELEEAERAAARKTKPKAKVCHQLSALGVYTASHSFKSSFQDESATNPSHVFSFSEKAFNSLHQTHSDAIFSHNKIYMMRVYPFGLRFGSSNPDPSLFWARGVQLVALNWQKVDEGMMLNEGMFAGYGGYVLKPDSHRPSTTTTPEQVMKVLDMKITVLAAQNLPLPKENEKAKDFEPYVKVELHVEGKAELKKKTKTKKGVDVAWGEHKGHVEFMGVKDVIDSLSFIRFKVLDDEFGADDLSAWTCIRLDRLRNGYRFLHLYDSKGRETNSIILVKVDKLLR